uniref:Astacin domain-containing protein n=1 Tax=Strongyloides papillosus TaxID=174720 RepID=A0A0N5B5F3_STREA
MKTFLLTLLLLLCINKGYADEEVQVESESNLKPRTPPPYNIGEKVNYFNYSFEVSALPKVGKDIERIFRQIKHSTCLTFEKKNTLIKDTIGINFNISDSGNKVELSDNKNRPTNVSLEEKIYTNFTMLRFYIGIALDIIPEIRRPDRDIDVNVNMSNVDDNFIQYYNITNSSYITYLNDTEFDFRSPMFLGPDFGSKNNKSTYEVLLYKGDQYPSGRNRPFRHNFYKDIFYYYCNGTAKENNCKYGGYPYPGNTCKCPEHFSGTYCTEFNNKSVIPTNYTIPAPLEANSTKLYYSVNLTNTVFYLNITSRGGKNVSTTVENITFSETSCSSTGSFLEVLIRKDKAAAGMHLCRTSTNFTLPSLSSEVFFVMEVKKENVYLNISYMEAEEKNKEQQEKKNE